MTDDAGAVLRHSDAERSPRPVRVSFRGGWGGRGRGLRSSDPRGRTLRKVLVA